MTYEFLEAENKILFEQNKKLRSAISQIREEIAELEEEVFQRTKDYSDYACVRNCLDIIDKYKAESEDKDE